MCLIIATLLLVYAIVAFSKGNVLVGSVALAASLFFAGLMAYNIKKVRDSKR